MAAPAIAATLYILLAGVIGIVIAVLQGILVSKVKVFSRPSNSGLSQDDNRMEMQEKLLSEEEDETTAKLHKIHGAICEGANAFLWAEYKIMFGFIVGFGIIVLVLIGTSSHWVDGIFSAVSFATGGLTSILSGYIGMRIAVYANVRTAVSAQEGYETSFKCAFRAGSVMGFALCSAALLVLFVLIELFDLQFPYKDDPVRLFEAIAGYGLGGSSIALFGRVGGGIYTKAADVGADLVGKVEAGIPEDDPRNPGVIADNVGDNVGDVAGMGADLFGSFAEATCAALVVASHSQELNGHWSTLMFPLLISAAGIIVCMFTVFITTYVWPVREMKTIELNLKMNLVVSTILMTPLLYWMSNYFLPDSFCVKMGQSVHGFPAECIQSATDWKAFFCVGSGLWSGLIIGFVTEYYTSHSYAPVRELADSCKWGPAPCIIFGLALGDLSVIIPVSALCVSIFFSYHLCAMFGVALAALGMLSTLAIGLTIDAYGPISDNAGGIAEMAALGDHVRERTDALDAAGNTTAAIGKGFAIGSAALVSLALFGAFVTRTGTSTVDILRPVTFAFLLFGAMLPYWFTALTMKAVGIAANAMVEEIRRQFAEKDILSGREEPDYKACVEISTKASIREMIAPGALVMLTPLLTGYLFGVHAVTGLLAGGMVSGVQMAISSSNTGGAWDNAKKYIELGISGRGGQNPALEGKGSGPHKAAVIGDTVGDPLKDTSGPSLNILMKLMAILSLVFAPFFIQHSLNLAGKN